MIDRGSEIRFGRAGTIAASEPCHQHERKEAEDSAAAKLGLDWVESRGAHEVSRVLERPMTVRQPACYPYCSTRKGGRIQLTGTPGTP
jgi:hypothetical protein